ncbi:MAG TPA: pitrilysin family protein [Anaerolineales bacterium]|nr:pitrilysin family protein [Anaerolineales bacterium]
MAASAIPGPENITRQTLGNGITVLARPNFNSPSITITGYLQVGGLVDPDEKLGLALFTAACLTRGTSRRSFQEFHEALEAAGARLGIASGTHTTSFHGQALAEDLDLLLGSLAEALTQPNFPIEQIERLRTQLLTGLAMRAQDTEEMAGLICGRLLFGSHPYSRPGDGYPETIQAITRQDLSDFHARAYGPRGMIIVVVGGIDPSLAIERVNAALGGWQNPVQPPPAILPDLIPLNLPVRQDYFIPGKSQADLIAAWIGPTRHSPDYLPAALGNNILGEFGMMGRIGEVVREKAGLAYSAQSSFSAGIGPGTWSVDAGVDPVNVNQALDLIQSEVRRFTSEPVSLSELVDSQDNYIGSLPLSLESNIGVASALMTLEKYQLGLDYYLTYADRIRAVTVEQVLETAQRYLDPECMAVAVAGTLVK